MPTYDYECDACGHTWELFQKITEDPVNRCPACKKKKARRLFGTGAAIVFKGAGFYQTDYRSESYKKGQQAANESSDKGKASDVKSADSKSSGKSESSSPANSSSDSANSSKSSEKSGD